jgi:hypothetical protein
MKLTRRCLRTFILASLCLLAISTTTSAQVSGEKQPGQTEAESLQKKAREAQARIRENEADESQLVRAVKINEVALAKEVLLKNGFTATDLENAKITLLSGGGNAGDARIAIFASCCNPKEITIQRTLEHFTK